MKITAFMFMGICFTAEAAEKIVLQPMSELDGMTKEELVEHREKKMIYSSFYRYDYKTTIFDRLKDGEKWVGDKSSCYRNKFYDGKSEASIWLNNPNILVHLSLNAMYGMYYGNTYNPVFCMYAKQLLFKPKSIVYDEKKKEIVSSYKAYNVLLGIGSHTHGALSINLSAINAYDAGFNYINLAQANGIVFDSERSGKSMKSAMSEALAIRTDVAFCDPCYVKTPGACNCYRKEGEWTVKLDSPRAEMLFKLWKDQPKSVNDEADFYYRIKFAE